MGQQTVGQKAIVFSYKTVTLVTKLDILFIYSMKYILRENSCNAGRTDAMELGIEALLVCEIKISPWSYYSGHRMGQNGIQQ